MRIGRWKRRITTGMVFLALAAAGVYELATRTEVFDRKMSAKIVVNGREKGIEIPSYNPVKVPPTNCSRYARLCAQEVFGKHYSFSDAWDRRHEDRVVCGADNLERVAAEGVLQPGMLVTWKNPESVYLIGRDKKGKERNCSHVALYLGRNPETKELMFAEQRGWKNQVIGYGRFKSDGLIPVEVIDSKD